MHENVPTYADKNSSSSEENFEAVQYIEVCGTFAKAALRGETFSRKHFPSKMKPNSGGTSNISYKVLSILCKTILISELSSGSVHV